MVSSELHFHCRMDRRTFLEHAVIWPTVAFLAQGMHPPESGTDAPAQYPAPGWIETTTAPLPPLLRIPPAGGNPLEYYARHIAVHSPVIRHILSDHFRTILAHEPTGISTIGDHLSRHILWARHAIRTLHQDDAPSVATVGHAASLSLGIALSPYLRMADVRTLIAESGNEQKESYELRAENIHPSAHASDVFLQHMPRVFPIDSHHCFSAEDARSRCRGTDRGQHFSSHNLLSGQYYYADQHQLQDAARIPRNLSRFLAVRADTREKKARLLSAVAGNLWEVNESLRYLLRPDRYTDGSRHPGGIWPIDRLVGYDYAANDLGSQTGIILNHPYLTEHHVETVIARLSTSNPSPLDDLLAALEK